MIGIRRRVPACSGTASASDSTLPQARHFQMPFFVDATESLLRCPHCAHVAIRAFICNSTIYKLGSATPVSFDVKLNRGNLKAESVWLATHRCRYVTPYRGRAAGGFDDSPRGWNKGARNLDQIDRPRLRSS